MPTYQQAKNAGHWAAYDAICEHADRMARREWRALTGHALRADKASA